MDHGYTQIFLVVPTRQAVGLTSVALGIVRALERLGVDCVGCRLPRELRGAFEAGRAPGVGLRYCRCHGFTDGIRVAGVDQLRRVAADLGQRAGIGSDS